MPLLVKNSGNSSLLNPGSLLLTRYFGRSKRVKILRDTIMVALDDVLFTYVIFSHLVLASTVMSCMLKFKHDMPYVFTIPKSTSNYD